MSGFDYWLEALDCALDETGAYDLLSAAQREQVAKRLRSAAEMEGEATGHYSIPDPMLAELKATQDDLAKERRKVGCSVCRGTGRIGSYSGPWWCESQCDKCHGHGKHAP